eukprot:1209792-Amphidinium_carterae.1
MKDVEGLPEILHLQECTARLQAFCRGHLVSDVELDKKPSLSRALQLAMKQGDGALRKEAEK